MKIGLLGGTFDPVHEGHLALAESARVCAELDEVLLVPSGIPPHRRPAVAAPEQRLEMARLATADRPGLGVWDVEVRRPGPSFTVETLEAFHRERPGDEPFLILGWDAARLLHTWHRPKDVLELATLVVLPRPGLPPPSVRDLSEAGLEPGRVIVCVMPTPDVAATRIRDRIAGDEPLDGLLPAAVASYIARHDLYEAGEN